LNGSFRCWIYSPKLADHAQRLGAFCRYETGLPLRLSELAILVIAARWRAQAEWFIHHPIALHAGVREQDAEAIRTGRLPSFDDADDALIYTLSTELLDTKRLSDGTYLRTIERFGLAPTVNLVALLGYCTLVAMTLNMFEVGANNQTSLPPRRDFA